MKNSSTHDHQAITTPRRSRLKTYAKLTVGSVSAASAASSAEAAIVYFDVNPDQTISNGEIVAFGDINLGAGTYTLNSQTDPDFSLAIYSGGTILMTEDSSVQWGYNLWVFKLTYGTPIEQSTAPSWGGGFQYLIGGGSGYWASGGSGYAPLRLAAGAGSYYYGWVGITLNGPSGPGLTATVTGFAFEDVVDTAIAAGDQGGGPAPVPEPGTMAVGAGLFALAVGAHLRRRREKKAAASDALLNLAAGARGVEKFRADKAA